MDITWHYPPELMNLLIDTIPLLNRGKKDVFLFFQGAGVADTIMEQQYTQWRQDSASINKFEIVRQVLTKLNEKGESGLRERREILKRVVEFESFSSCWPKDQLKAKGLVSEIQRVVNVKDSFTRMDKARRTEQRDRIAQMQSEREKIQIKTEDILKVKENLYGLFSENDRQKRGKALEGVLNRLFQSYDISVREAFTISGDRSEGVVEQIDGVVEIEGHLYFVEMKWWEKPLGVPEISQHLTRVMFRAESRAIIISASNFTAPAISLCKEALQQKVLVLCTLHELVALLDRQGDLIEFLKMKIHAAVIDRNPFKELLR